WQVFARDGLLEWQRVEFLPIRPDQVGVRGASGKHEASPRCVPRNGDRSLLDASRRNFQMKALLSVLLAAVLVCSGAPAALAAPHQVIQGTQMHLTLLSSIGTSMSKDGDPFVAVVSEPVFIGNTLLIPAGTRVNGIVGTVERARRFSIVRGEA